MVWCGMGSQGLHSPFSNPLTLERETDGMVWYGMVWYGMVWYSQVWYGIVEGGNIRYGMVWYGMKRAVLVRA